MSSGWFTCFLQQWLHIRSLEPSWLPHFLLSQTTFLRPSFENWFLFAQFNITTLTLYTPRKPQNRSISKLEGFCGSHGEMRSREGKPLAQCHTEIQRVSWVWNSVLFYSRQVLSTIPLNACFLQLGILLMPEVLHCRLTYFSMKYCSIMVKSTDFGASVPEFKILNPLLI